jgi:hypothetical protein
LVEISLSPPLSRAHAHRGGDKVRIRTCTHRGGDKVRIRKFEVLFLPSPKGKVAGLGFCVVEML